MRLRSTLGRRHRVLGGAVLVRRPPQRMGAATAERPGQLAAELEPGDGEHEEVARVVRQADLVDDLAHGEVDDVATPRRVGGHVDRATFGVEVLAVREHDRQHVDHGGRQRGEDHVERHGQQHRVCGRRFGRLEAS